MTLEARRKNQGKQYSVVSTDDRVIRYWHRPGDHLPVMLTHAGKGYLLTKEVVAEARKNQRSKLIVLQVDDSGDKLVPAPRKLRKYFTEVTPVDVEINWKTVGWVVSTVFALACLATVLALGA